jgi:hypothetical protein
MSVMSDPLAAQLLLADAGIPMIVLAFPAMLMLLVPITVAEGFLYKKWLALTTWEAMKSSAASNLASTIIGVPIAWAIMFGVEFAGIGLMGRNHAIENWHSPLANILFLFFGSAWLRPPDRASLWIIPAACLVLLIPFFFASYWIEHFVVKWMVGSPAGGPPHVAYPRVRIAVRNANLITYGAMFLATTVWLLVELPHH